MSSKLSKISAIIPTYNSENTISKCIDTLLNQSIDIEIITIDDGSTDKTGLLLQEYQNKIIVLNQNHQGPAVARNFGVSVARGDILVFVDSDMYFDLNFIKDLVAPIRGNGAIGTYTTEERVSNWDNIWARCWNIEEDWEKGKRFKKGSVEGTDYRSILKKDFLRVGGFDNIGYTDSWSLYHKLARRPVRTKAICYHKNPDNLKDVFSHASWIAKRPYKLGLIGALYALVRASLPISILTGIYKSLTKLTPEFFIFKLVFDLGRFTGVFSMLTSRSMIK